jgi:transposase, IS30 family
LQIEEFFMGRTYQQLTMDERRQIDRLRAQKTSIDGIAERIGRHRSTVYREIKRNWFIEREIPDLTGYWCTIAHKMAAERRARLTKLLRHDDLLKAIVAKLQSGWSPEQVAGRLRLDGSPRRVCHETIYRFAYSKAGHADAVYRYLPEQRRRRRPRRARSQRGLHVPDSRSISNRPAAVADRTEFGHWEGDLLMFRREHGKGNVTSLVERKSRFAILLRNNDRQSRPVFNAMIAAFAPLPRAASRSFTFDRGTEFAAYDELDKGLGATTWFCDPRSPWQKGAVENTNRRLRAFLPDSTNPFEITAKTLRLITLQINRTPRKCLGFRTPEEEFRRHLLEIEHERA